MTDPPNSPAAIERVPIASLRPYQHNPRRHSEEQVAKLAASLVEFGWTQPILVDDANSVVAGHGRLLAALRLGIDEVPVIRLAHLTAEQARAYRIADNKLTELAGWDDDWLAAEMHALNGAGYELGLTGFSAEELEQLLAPLDEAEQAMPAATAEEATGGQTVDDPQPAAPLVTLADRFGIPPFSVLNARSGWWQERKRAWLALGIRSELGRGDIEPGNGGGGGAWGHSGPSERYRRRAKATPGGAPMPAADYGKSGARGDGRGRAIA